MFSSSKSDAHLLAARLIPAGDLEPIGRRDPLPPIELQPSWPAEEPKPKSVGDALADAYRAKEADRIWRLVQEAAGGTVSPSPEPTAWDALLAGEVSFPPLPDDWVDAVDLSAGVLYGTSFWVDGKLVPAEHVYLDGPVPRLWESADALIVDDPSHIPDSEQGLSAGVSARRAWLAEMAAAYMSRPTTGWDFLLPYTKGRDPAVSEPLDLIARAIAKSQYECEWGDLTAGQRQSFLQEAGVVLRSLEEEGWAVVPKKAAAEWVYNVMDRQGANDDY